MVKMKEPTLGKTLRANGELLTIVFLTLRACDIVSWPWYIVLLPQIALNVIGVVLLAVLGVVTAWERSR